MSDATMFILCCNGQNILTGLLFSLTQRIKSTQIHKLLKEEKEAYTEQVAMLQHQLEVTSNVVRKLEEKERILQTAIANLEKELKYVYR